jgi:predicted metal-dependent peptidase
VLKDLLKDAQQQQSGGKGGKGGTSAGNGHQSLDEHMFDEAEEMSPAEAKKVQQQVEDAVRQGKLLAERMRGDGKGGADLSALTAHRDTNWREYLREFLSTICQGDDNSRFCPPNKRMLASGFVMPSHFSESTGEIIVACDTSGSMGGVYPVVFGEIARICEHARPESVRVLWWDTDVNSEQVFKPDQYDQIAGVLKPQGGGGTTVSVVARYIAEKQLKPKAVVYLSDGYVESDYEVPDVPCLWGIVDNDSFMPLKGKVVRIYSEGV